MHPQDEEAVGGGINGSNGGSSPPRRTSSSASTLPPHLRAHEMALSPSSPLHSGAAILIRHRESSGGSFNSPVRPKLRSEDGGMEEGGFVATVATVMKVCMGTGLLALPYAVARGGLGVSALGIALMGAWNYKAVNKLLECRDAIEGQVEAEGVEANGLFAFIGLKACGRPGQAIVNFSLGATLFGAAISYLVAASDALVASFPGGDPVLTRLLSSALSLAVVLPLSLRPFSFLSYTSVAGLLALGLAFLVLILNGIATLSNGDGNPTAAEPAPSPWQQTFSTTPRGLAEFYGVVSFCFGIPPLAFPIEGSMGRPDRFPSAVRWSMAAVALLYIGICEAVALLYPNAPSNILMALPADSVLATSVRLLIAAVCLLSYPLALVPLAESMEKALVPACASSDEERAPLRGGAGAAAAPAEGGRRARLAVRVGVVVASAMFAAGVPCISVIISFIGAFSVALLALVLPPLFHLCLVSMRQAQRDALKDAALLVLGSVATIVATVLTAQAGFLSILFTHKCPSS